MPAELPDPLNTMQNSTTGVPMEQQVTVIDVQGSEAIVHGRRASACGDCAGKASCSTMGSWVERIIELRVRNTVHAQKGDVVLLEVPDNAVLRIAFRLYAMPMLAFVVAGLCMRALAVQLAWANAELWAALGGIAAVIGYYLWYKSHLASTPASGMDVRMIRIIQHQCESSG